MTSIVKVDKIVPATGTTTTLGESGDTIQLGAGATAIGFGGGKVLQYKYMSYSTETQSTSSSWIATGFDLDITPTSASSVLRITASLRIDGYKTNSVRSGYASLRLMRNTSTNIYEMQHGSYRNMNVTNENRGFTGPTDVNWVDAPNTTSSVNYILEFRNDDVSCNVFNNNVPGLFEIWEIEL